MPGGRFLMHHYPHHIGDYRTHTAHLTMVEDGAYRRLLDIYYMHEKPLPADIAVVQRLTSARSKEERAAVETILREFFALEEDGWHQRRADDEIGAYQARADQARKNGKGGGRPKTQRKPRNNQVGYSTDTQSEPDEKLTVNREPLTENLQKDHSVANAPPMPSKRGSRLTDDWALTDDLSAFASSLGLDPHAERDAFVDYWTSVPGSRGLKLDWGKTFKNRCRDLASRGGAKAMVSETWNERRIREGMAVIMGGQK